MTTAGSSELELADEPSPGRSRRRWLRWALWGMGVVVFLMAIAGVYVWREYRKLTSAKYNVIDYKVPSRRTLSPAPARMCTASTPRSQR